jgi:thiol-disulfide isomerase/thioredoxin
MGRTLPVLAVFAVAVLLVASNPSGTRYPKPSQINVSLGSALARLRGRIGSAAPELTFRLVSDDSVHLLSEFQSKVVLLNIWATGCGPCRAEMPALVSLQKRHGADRLAVITLASEPRERIRRSSNKSGLVLPPLSGYWRSMDWVPNQAWPLTIVIDADGTIREVSLGQQSEEQFNDAVRRYL